jgi:RsiW-degrading membrane proteinase PrsW (M82 family)
MIIIIALSPVILFLLLLIYLDSFKLVKKSVLGFAFIFGTVSAGMSYLSSIYFQTYISDDHNLYVRIIGPLIEEFFKYSFVIFLLRKRYFAFIIDAAIYGFAIGAGFSLIENIFYIELLKDPDLTVWFVRGVGTALMHGACTSIASLILITFLNTKSNLFYFIGLLFAYTIHIFYNSFFFNPLISVSIVLLGFTLTLMFLFNYNQISIEKWINSEFDSEIELLQFIKSGNLSGSHIGKYILSIKDKFSSFIIFDMICLINLNLELSIRAKTNIMLKQNEITIPEDKDLEGILIEYKELQKRIGKTGMIALKPILQISHRDLWKLKVLK